MLGIASLCTLPNIYLGITGGAEFHKNLPGTGINIWQAQIVAHMGVTAVTMMAGFGADDKVKSK